MAWTEAGQIRENMTFGTALPTTPPSGTSTCPGGNVRLGVFFDGTNNNAWRDWGSGFIDWKPGSARVPDVNHLRPANPGTDVKPEDLNGPTNIARLYFLFRDEGCCQKRVYATGVGSGDANMAPGRMFTVEGTQGLGGRARINWGIAWVTEFVNRDNHHLAVEKRIDTFGFSRGATQARDFLNKVMTARIENRRVPPTGHRFEAVGLGDPMGYSMPPMVRVDTYPEMRGILFEYLGITDTVASEGLGTLGQGGDSLAGYNLAVLGRPKQANKTPKEILDVPSTPANVVDKEGWVHRTYHQIADDEFRDVFASELLGNSPAGGRRGFKHLPENMREQSYPGCHADIGGGYRNSPGVAAVPGEEVTDTTDMGTFTTRVGAKPAVEPIFINISNLTLQHVVEDARKAGVPFADPSTLPKGLHEIDPDAPESVPKLSELYAKYCQLRANLIKKHAADYPKWGDYTHDIVHAPVYIQSYPDAVYRAIATEMRQDPDYIKLRTYYSHNSSGGIYQWAVNPLRRVVRSTFVEGPFTIGRDTRKLPSLFGNDRQRDVHYHGFQNSYDHTCDNGRSVR